MSKSQEPTKTRKPADAAGGQVEPRLMTTAQLASYLNMNRGSIYNAIGKGNFPLKPVPLPCQGKQRPAIRWDRRAVDRWIDTQAAEGR